MSQIFYRFWFQCEACGGKESLIQDSGFNETGVLFERSCIRCGKEEGGILVAYEKLIEIALKFKKKKEGGDGPPTGEERGGKQ